MLLFSCSVVSDSLWPHGLQHTRLPCPSLSPGVCSDSPPLSQWCHPTISSSATSFSFCFQSFPALGSFPMSQLSASGGQSIGASALVLPMNIQGWFPLGLTDLISFQGQAWSVFGWRNRPCSRQGFSWIFLWNLALLSLCDCMCHIYLQVCIRFIFLIRFWIIWDKNHMLLIFVINIFQCHSEKTITNIEKKKGLQTGVSWGFSIH